MMIDRAQREADTEKATYTKQCGSWKRLLFSGGAAKGRLVVRDAAPEDKQL